MNDVHDNRTLGDVNGVGLASGDQAQDLAVDFPKFPSLFSELQLRIIGFLVGKKDILNVILVNKSLYCLCIGLLYRDLDWSNPVVCAGIIRQAELQRRGAATSNLSLGPVFKFLLGRTQNPPLPRLPTAFDTTPRSLVLSLAYNRRKLQTYNTSVSSYDFFADVGTIVTSTDHRTSEYVKEKLDNSHRGYGFTWSNFVRNLRRIREPLYFSNRDFRVDLPTVMASMDTMDLTSQIPHWKALSYLRSGATSNNRSSDRFDFYTSLPLYNQILVMITRFTHLNTLVFYNSNLPPRLYDAIVLLTNLRTLVIDSCFLPPFILPGVEVDDNIDGNVVPDSPEPETLQILPTIRDFSQLPITSLTLLRIRPHTMDSYPSRSRAFTYDIHSQFLDEVQAFKLASAQNLIELAVDWTDVSARYFGGVRPDGANVDDRTSTNPMVAAFGRYAATAYPNSYHEPTTTTGGGSAGLAPLHAGNATNLTAIVTNDLSGRPYVLPRGLTSVTLSMGVKWSLPYAEVPPGQPINIHAPRPFVTILDCSALLSSFLKKFEDGVDTARPGLQHLKIFSSGANNQTVLGWQNLRDRMEEERRGREVEIGNDGEPLDAGGGGGGGGVPRALRHLDLEQRMTSVFFPLHPSIVLPRLKSFMGPLHTIPSVLRRSLADNPGDAEEFEGMGYVAQNLERVVIWDELWFMKAYPSNQIVISYRDSRDMDEEMKVILKRAMDPQNMFDILGIGTPGSSSLGSDVVGASHQISSTLKVLKIPLAEWSEEILYAISQHLTDLRVFEVCYSKGGISEHALLSLGARFLSKLPHLHTLRLWNPSSTWKDKRERTYLPQFRVNDSMPPLASKPTVSSNGTSVDDARLKHTQAQATDEDGDDEDDGELEFRCLMAWKRHINELQELQLFPGVIWRRHSIGDVWTKREIVREGLDLDLDVGVGETAVGDSSGGGWANGMHWQYWDKRDVVRASWRRGCGLEAMI